MEFCWPGSNLKSGASLHILFCNCSLWLYSSSWFSLLGYWNIINSFLLGWRWHLGYVFDIDSKACFIVNICWDVFSPSPSLPPPPPLLPHVYLSSPVPSPRVMFSRFSANLCGMVASGCKLTPAKCLLSELRHSRFVSWANSISIIRDL